MNVERPCYVESAPTYIGMGFCLWHPSSSVLGFTMPLCGLIHDAVQEGRRKGAENIITYLIRLSLMRGDGSGSFP